MPIPDLREIFLDYQVHLATELISDRGGKSPNSGNDFVGGTRF
jgi:hypothetical protein